MSGVWSDGSRPVARYDSCAPASARRGFGSDASANGIAAAHDFREHCSALAAAAPTGRMVLPLILQRLGGAAGLAALFYCDRGCAGGAGLRWVHDGQLVVAGSHSQAPGGRGNGAKAGNDPPRTAWHFGNLI